MSDRRNLRAVRQMRAQQPVELPPEQPDVTGCYPEPCPPNMVRQEPYDGREVAFQPLGDAGADIPSFRATQFFWQVQADLQPTSQFTTPHVLATAQSYDRRIQLWNINISGIDALREVGAVPAGPAQLTTLSPTLGAGATQGTAVKARVEIQNQSGRIFQDIDILGARSIEVYAWAVTVFALLPVNSYEVLQVAGVINATFDGVICDSLFGAQISSVAVNGTQVPDQVTRFVTVPAGAAILVPTPPGAREVQIHSVVTPAPANTFNFDNAGAAPVASSSLGEITFLAGFTSTDFLRIPNALAIRAGGGGEPGGNYTFVYTVER